MKQDTSVTMCVVLNICLSFVTLYNYRLLKSVSKIINVRTRITVLLSVVS